MGTEYWGGLLDWLRSPPRAAGMPPEHAAAGGRVPDEAPVGARQMRAFGDANGGRREHAEVDAARAAAKADATGRAAKAGATKADPQ